MRQSAANLYVRVCPGWSRASVSSVNLNVRATHDFSQNPDGQAHGHHADQHRTNLSTAPGILDLSPRALDALTSGPGGRR